MQSYLLSNHTFHAMGLIQDGVVLYVSTDSSGISLLYFFSSRGEFTKVVTILPVSSPSNDVYPSSMFFDFKANAFRGLLFVMPKGDITPSSLTRKIARNSAQENQCVTYMQGVDSVYFNRGTVSLFGDLRFHNNSSPLGSMAQYVVTGIPFADIEVF
jgi:hypothetical protein